MKLLNCPMNGLRPIGEFIYGGEYREMPNPNTSSDLEWASYVHYRDNAPGVKKEWWLHSPSGTWFIAVRNTLSDEVLNTYLFGKAPLANNENLDDENLGDVKSVGLLV